MHRARSRVPFPKATREFARESIAVRFAGENGLHRTAEPFEAQPGAEAAMIEFVCSIMGNLARLIARSNSRGQHFSRDNQASRGWKQRRKPTFTTCRLASGKFRLRVADEHDFFARLECPADDHFVPAMQRRKFPDHQPALKPFRHQAWMSLRHRTSATTALTQKAV